MKLIRSALAAAFLITSTALPLSASADTAWRTDRGIVGWDTVVGTYAVFKFYDENSVVLERTPTLFLEGLAAQYSTVGIQPGVYHGFWMRYDQPESCDAANDAYGNQSTYWGRLAIKFDNMNNFEAQFTSCGEEQPHIFLSGARM